MLLPETELEFAATTSGSCGSDCKTYCLITNPNTEGKSHFGLTFFSLSIPSLPWWAFWIRHALFKNKTGFIENMWCYNLGILYKEAGEDLTEFDTIQEQDIFPQTNCGEVSRKCKSKIVSDVHILTLRPVNTPENHRNLIRDGFLSHTMAKCPGD